MFSWLGTSSNENSIDGEEQQALLEAHKLLMKTLSLQSLSQTRRVDEVWCSDNHSKSTTAGTLCLTGHNMILYANDTKKEIWIHYRNIDSVERRIGLDKGTIVIKCKDLKQFSLTIPGVDEASNVAYTAETLANVLDPHLQFPYFYRPKFEISEDGWELFRIDKRIAKLNMTSERWRISDINFNFECCRSYPTHIIVPNDIKDDVLMKAAKFRQGGRFPVMSYCHKNTATIIRSSQPLVGSSNRRCKEDEKLLNAMLGPSHKGYIFDIRSEHGATQAKIKGGGYESQLHYSRWKRMHTNLKNYFVQQESLIKIVEASNDKSGNMDRWLSKIESSNWMEYVKRSLDAACLVAQCVDWDGWSVLVHGSEGFDSTLTVTSLAQVILDPKCRTIRGFLTLIDQEWLRAGHPFGERMSRGPYSNYKQRSEGPIFPIFLECVFQVLQQFPLSFEFTSRLLVDLRHHCYSSQFGTFLFNSVQERLRAKLQSKTVSLWSLILSPSEFVNYVNPLYRKNNSVIWPSVAPQSLEFWEEYYIPDLNPPNPTLDRVRTLQKHRMELELLRSQVSQTADTGGANGPENVALSKEESSVTRPGPSPSLVLNKEPSQSTSETPMATPDAESQSCFYVSIAGDVTYNQSSDSHSVNSQPDLLEDLLSFVNNGDDGPTADAQNLPDLDDLAIDSPESGSPEAVSPTPC